MAQCVWEGCEEEVPLSIYENGGSYQPKYCEPHKRARWRQAAAARSGGITSKEDTKGYVWIKRGDEWVPEHRAVMEERIGRPLRQGETVLHKNRARNDNRLENLILLGEQSFESLVCPHCGKGYSESPENVL